MPFTGRWPFPLGRHVRNPLLLPGRLVSPGQQHEHQRRGEEKGHDYDLDAPLDITPRERPGTQDHPGRQQDHPENGEERRTARIAVGVPAHVAREPTLRLPFQLPLQRGVEQPAEKR